MGVIERCVCRDVTFKQLRVLVVREGLGVDELCDRTGCGSACSLCLPYIRVMVETGRVTFDSDRPPSSEPKRRAPGRKRGP